MSCRSLEKKENRTHHNSILFGVLHVYTVTHVIGRCTTTLRHRFRAVYPCLDKIFWKLLKLNTSPSKPLKYSVKDSEFKQSMASHATSFDGEPSRLKLMVRRVASQFFLVSPDSQVDEALADPTIFRIIFYKSK